MKFFFYSRLIATVVLLVGALACKPTDFSSSGSQKTKPVNADKSNDGTPANKGKNKNNELGKEGKSEDGSNFDINPAGDLKNSIKKPKVEIETDSGVKKDCVDLNLKTKARLVSINVANGAPGNKIVYELSVVDCNGDRKPVSGKYILFDVDARVQEMRENTYKARVGLESTTGVLNSVEGVDLFGKTGSEYFHHRTDKTVSLKGTITSVTLTIELGGQSFSPHDGSDTGSFMVNTHLKFGDADPVTQPVLFLD